MNGIGAGKGPKSRAEVATGRIGVGKRVLFRRGKGGEWNWCGKSGIILARSGWSMELAREKGYYFGAEWVVEGIGAGKGYKFRAEWVWRWSRGGGEGGIVLLLLNSCPNVQKVTYFFVFLRDFNQNTLLNYVTYCRLRFYKS